MSVTLACRARVPAVFAMSLRFSAAPTRCALGVVSSTASAVGAMRGLDSFVVFQFTPLTGVRSAKAPVVFFRCSGMPCTLATLVLPDLVVYSTGTTVRVNFSIPSPAATRRLRSSSCLLCSSLTSRSLPSATAVSRRSLLASSCAARRSSPTKSTLASFFCSLAKRSLSLTIRSSAAASRLALSSVRSCLSRASLTAARAFAISSLRSSASVNSASKSGDMRPPSGIAPSSSASRVSNICACCSNF